MADHNSVACQSLVEVPLALRADYAYRPGQFLTVRRRLGGEEIYRSYSLCSAPHEQAWKIGVREIPRGAFSSFANRELKVGDQIDCMPPDGLFCPEISASVARHYVLFAVGSGITPCLSIINAVLATSPASRVTLMYGNRRPFRGRTVVVPRFFLYRDSLKILPRTTVERGFSADVKFFYGVSHIPPEQAYARFATRGAI